MTEKKFKNDKKNKKKNKKESSAVKAVAQLQPENLKAVASKVQASQSQAVAGNMGGDAKAGMTAWETAGKSEGLVIWRVEKFAPVAWPKEMYGQFYDGDSYLVLNTYKVGSRFGWDIHFWIGDNSSQDEYGSAAYMAVQLDDKLGGGPVQHREVQGCESATFLEYFKPSITILKGGIESGFRHVEQEEHRNRLLHVKGKRHVRVTEVQCDSFSLNSGDVFILDAGNKIFLWNGSSSTAFEHQKGGELCTSMKNHRKAIPRIITLDENQAENDDYRDFWQILGGKGPIAAADEGGLDFDAESDVKTEKKLLKLSDASGSLQMSELASGPKVIRSLLKTEDVFILDSGFEIFVWVGKKASPQEKSNAFKYAQDYLQKAGKPAYFPITKIVEGGENPTFVAMFS